jgi:hypothetical protein
MVAGSQCLSLPPRELTVIGERTGCAHRRNRRRENMRNSVISLLFAFIACLLVSPAISADMVELKSGEFVEGEITEETDQFIAIETDVETSFIKKEDVKSIKETRLDAATGHIKELKGTVEVLPAGKEQWIPAKEEMPLNEGDSVRTGPDSNAIAVFENQVIMAVEQESNADLPKLQQTAKKDLIMKVDVDKGQIWSDVGKLRSKRSKFFVATPTCVTGVRGTVFTVQAESAEKTTVAVVEGGVDVRTRDMMAEPTKVGESQMTEVSPNKPPTKPIAISGVFLAQWALYATKFGLLHGTMGAGGLQFTPGQAAVAGGATAGVAGVAAAAQGGGGSSSPPPPPPDTVNVTAAESGVHSPAPIDREIDGSAVIAGRTVVRVAVRVLCDPFTVPDRFQIIYMGNVIGDTGMVGEDLGDPGENILLTGTANGTSPTVTIRVMTGPLGTDWHWDARVTYFVE